VNIDLNRCGRDAGSVADVDPAICAAECFVSLTPRGPGYGKSKKWEIMI
jgi:hypothetical protein